MLENWIWSNDIAGYSKIIDTDIENNRLLTHKFSSPNKMNCRIHHKEKQENIQVLYGN